VFNPELEEMPQPRRRGIALPDRFPFYFRLSPPEGGISQAEVSRIMENIESFRAQLEEFAGSRRKESGTYGLDRSEFMLAEISRNVIETTDKNAQSMFLASFEFFGRGEKPWILQSLMTNLLAKIHPDSRLS
jgi:hypothetical protein